MSFCKPTHDAAYAPGHWGSLSLPLTLAFQKKKKWGGTRQRWRWVAGGRATPPSSLSWVAGRCEGGALSFVLSRMLRRKGGASRRRCCLDRVCARPAQVYSRWCGGGVSAQKYMYIEEGQRPVREACACVERAKGGMSCEGQGSAESSCHGSGVSSPMAVRLFHHHHHHHHQRGRRCRLYHFTPAAVVPHKLQARLLHPCSSQFRTVRSLTSTERTGKSIPVSLEKEKHATCKHHLSVRPR